MPFSAYHAFSDNLGRRQVTIRNASRGPRIAPGCATAGRLIGPLALNSAILVRHGAATQQQDSTRQFFPALLDPNSTHPDTMASRGYMARQRRSSAMSHYSMMDGRPSIMTDEDYISWTPDSDFILDAFAAVMFVTGSAIAMRRLCRRMEMECYEVGDTISEVEEVTQSGSGADGSSDHEGGLLDSCLDMVERIENLTISAEKEHLPPPYEFAKSSNGDQIYEQVFRRDVEEEQRSLVHKLLSRERRTKSDLSRDSIGENMRKRSNTISVSPMAVALKCPVNQALKQDVNEAQKNSVNQAKSPGAVRRISCNIYQV